MAGTHLNQKTDEQLGMARTITRRDFVQGSTSALALGLLSPLAVEQSQGALETSLSANAREYPPAKTGLRGSHSGSFEVAHALAREGVGFSTKPIKSQESYDLVVVGAGISGLAAAHFYRQLFGEDSKILLLENHDDFGGHAKRNEFHQAGDMVLSLGGAHNLEWWNFSETVRDFMNDHNVDYEAMRKQMTFNYGRAAPNSPAMWFDRDLYGVNRLVNNLNLSDRLSDTVINQIPISKAGRESLKRFYIGKDLPVLNQNESQLSAISYPDFLREYGRLTDDAVQLFDKEEHGSWGLEMRAISASEALWQGYPGAHLFGDEWEDNTFGYPVAMWPDGNAGLARLIVAKLCPNVAPEATPDNVSVATFDYSKLDIPKASVRLRLNSTVVNVENTAAGVNTRYVTDGVLSEISSKHCVLACYHSVIPHICPSLPEGQKASLQYQVKMPLILTNVLIRNTKSLDALGIDAVSCPGRLHARLFLFKGINTGGHQHSQDDDGPVSLVFWGSISPPREAIDIRSQLRASRQALLDLSFDDFEREVRTVLDGLLGPAGFDVATDVLAITVNRWPHGYSYEYMDLWDPKWVSGEAPHEKARKQAGSISIANSDAGASAYTHVAIDEAWRAVNEF